MITNFVRFTTQDQLVLQGLIYKPEQQTSKAFLHIHGMAGNFYENRFLDAMAKELTDSGYTFLATNNRGHDIIADFPVAADVETYKRIGNAFEKFEESVYDIKAAVDYLADLGYTEIILCGHSLGAAKVVYYLSQTQDSRINRLVLMSPPDMVGLVEKESYHKDFLNQAEEMIKASQGSDLLPQKIWDWYYLSANTYVNLYSRGLAVDVFSTYDLAKPSPALEQIKIPVLAFFGEKDDAAIIPLQEALDIIKSKAKNAEFDTAIIPNGTHGYFAAEQEMALTISKWLTK